MNLIPLLLLFLLLAIGAVLALIYMRRKRHRSKLNPASDVIYTCNQCGERDCQCSTHQGNTTHE